MYTIYVDGALIFSPVRQQQRFALTDVILKEEAGKIATLELRVPPVNVGYGSINLMTSRVVLYDDATPIFAGRPISIRKDFLGNRRIVCESALGYLRDVLIEELLGPDTGLSNGSPLTSVMLVVLDIFGDQVDATRDFASFTTPATARNAYFYDWKPGASVLETLQVLTVRNRGTDPTAVHHHLDLSVRWSGSGGSVSNILDVAYDDDIQYGTQTIEFGKNLLDLDDYIDASNLFTVLDLYDSDNDVFYTYQESDMVNAYGWIEKYHSVSGISSWTNPTDGRMYEAEKYYTANARAVQTIKLSALDLKLAGLAADRFEVGKYYQVISAPHGLNTYYKCVRAVRRLLDPSKDVYEFGVTQKPLTRLLTH